MDWLIIHPAGSSQRHQPSQQQSRRSARIFVAPRILPFKNDFLKTPFPFRRVALDSSLRGNKLENPASLHGQQTYVEQPDGGHLNSCEAKQLQVHMHLEFGIYPSWGGYLIQIFDFNGGIEIKLYYTTIH